MIKMLGKFGVNPSDIGPKQAKASIFDAPTETMTNITPLLYQSGYITIKDYNKILDLYTLDIPNKEVRLGLMESLLPNYVGNETPEATTMVAYLFMIFRTVIWILPCVVCRLFVYRSLL